MNDFVKNYGAHVVGYLVSALSIVAGLPTAGLPPSVIPYVGLAGMLLTGLHSTQVAPNSVTVKAGDTSITQTGAGASAAAAKLLPVVLVCVLSAIALQGCASVQSFLSGPTGAVIVPAGVDVAIATAEQKGVTAAQINRISKAVLAADTSSATTVVGLTSAVNAQLAKLNLPAGDTAAFTILETAFDAYIVAKYGSNPTVAQVEADVALFLQAAIAATGG